MQLPPQAVALQAAECELCPLKTGLLLLVVVVGVHVLCGVSSKSSPVCSPVAAAQA